MTNNLFSFFHFAELGYSRILKKITLPLVHLDNCATWYYKLPDNAICAGRSDRKFVGQVNFY